MPEGTARRCLKREIVKMCWHILTGFPKGARTENGAKNWVDTANWECGTHRLPGARAVPSGTKLDRGRCEELGQHSHLPTVGPHKGFYRSYHCLT